MPTVREAADALVDATIGKFLKRDKANPVVEREKPTETVASPFDLRTQLKSQAADILARETLEQLADSYASGKPATRLKKRTR